MARSLRSSVKTASDVSRIQRSLGDLSFELALSLSANGVYDGAYIQECIRLLHSSKAKDVRRIRIFSAGDYQGFIRVVEVLPTTHPELQQLVLSGDFIGHPSNMAVLQTVLPKLSPKLVLRLEKIQPPAGAPSSLFHVLYMVTTCNIYFLVFSVREWLHEKSMDTVLDFLVVFLNAECPLVHFLTGPIPFNHEQSGMLVQTLQNNKTLLKVDWGPFADPDDVHLTQCNSLLVRNQQDDAFERMEQQDPSMTTYVARYPYMNGDAMTRVLSAHPYLTHVDLPVDVRDDDPIITAITKSKTIGVVHATQPGLTAMPSRSYIGLRHPRLQEAIQRNLTAYDKHWYAGWRASQHTTFPVPVQARVRFALLLAQRIQLHLPAEVWALIFNHYQRDEDKQPEEHAFHVAHMHEEEYKSLS